MPRYYVGKGGFYFGKRRYRPGEEVVLPDGMQPPPDAVLVKPPEAQAPQSPPTTAKKAEPLPDQFAASEFNKRHESKKQQP
jgi:hypothetical protein